MCTASFLPPCFFSPAWCQPFIHSLTVGMKGGFLGRLGNGILWALSENLQIKRAGLMESNGGVGGEVVGVLGKGMYLLAASQKTSKINMFEGANRNCCRPRSISPQFRSLPPALSPPFMILDIHFTCKSIKVLLSKPSNPFLIMSMIVPINICSRGARGGGWWWWGGWLGRIGQGTMAAYDNLLFIEASRQSFHPPPLWPRPHEAAAPINRATSCQTGLNPQVAH